MAIAMSETSVHELLNSSENLEIRRNVTVGCIKSPVNVTLTGRLQCLNELKMILDSRGIFARILETQVAYHSITMETIASEYEASLGQLLDNSAALPSHPWPVMYSSVTASPLSTHDLLEARYWVRNLLQPVQFSQAAWRLCTYLKECQTMSESAIDYLIEVGPHAALRRLVHEIFHSDLTFMRFEYGSMLKQGYDAVETCLELMGQLLSRGFELNYQAINEPECDAHQMQALVDLPSYPFNHEHSFWIESRLSKNFRFQRHPRHELLGLLDLDLNGDQRVWRNVLKLSEERLDERSQGMSY